ncbi:hypothetical protein [Curtobacterium sp. L1-20]|uniref:hypothetical protein n=1 Tax=Curtobacterium sp. L1-20 TaxID=3138181 RepID=UPI003B52FE7F
MAQRGPTRPTARIEEAIGFVGMFGVLVLAVTVFCELTGRPALGWALTLLVLVAGVVVLDRWRVSVLRRAASTDGIGGAGADAAAPTRPRVAPASAARTVPSGSGSGLASGSGSASASVEARAHRHVGWDDLAPAGRRPVRADRTAPAPAQAGHRGDVTRPADG